MESFVTPVPTGQVARVRKHKTGGREQRIGAGKHKVGGREQGTGQGAV